MSTGRDRDGEPSDFSGFSLGPTKWQTSTPTCPARSPVEFEMMAQGSTIDSQPCCRAWFDALDPVLPAEMIGLWRGVGIPSGHPLDGVLENLQWFGKRFHADLSADALLFQWKPGRLVPLDPALIPIRMTILFAPFGRTFVARNWLSYMQKVFRARGTTASFKLRMIDGGETAAMVYDRRPIVDYFRWIKDDELAGMMVVEGDERRYFFRLQRVDVPTRNGSS